MSFRLLAYCIIYLSSTKKRNDSFDNNDLITNGRTIRRSSSPWTARLSTSRLKIQRRGRGGSELWKIQSSDITRRVGFPLGKLLRMMRLQFDNDESMIMFENKCS